MSASSCLDRVLPITRSGFPTTTDQSVPDRNPNQSGIPKVRSSRDAALRWPARRGWHEDAGVPHHCARLLCPRANRRRGAVVAFADQMRFLQPFTHDVGLLERAIASTSAHGDTALFSTLYVVLKEFARAGENATEVRRPAIVVLTDGEDNASLVGQDDVIELVRRTGVAISRSRSFPRWRPGTPMLKARTGRSTRSTTI